MSIPEIRVYSPSDKRNESNMDVSHFPFENVKFWPFMTTSVKGHDSNIDMSMTERNVKTEPHEPSVETSASNVLPQNGDSMVPWKNTFHMRPFNLTNFPASTTTYRTTYRSQTLAMQRARLGITFSPAKSLDILRQNVQSLINKELDKIIQHYLEKFFKPAIVNIKANSGDNAVAEQHVHSVCRQILEEAKKMYQGTNTRGNSPAGDVSDSENTNPSDKVARPFQKSPLMRKRKDSDTDSEASQNMLKPGRKKKGRPPVHGQGGTSGRLTPMKLKLESVKRDGPKWDPQRLTADTQFIMGAKANKALGLGATRGRLYIKHPDIFKYSGDQEDKQWLYEHGLMPATGGKAYMLMVQDIRELAESDEYRNSPSLMLDEIVGFVVPETMLAKMREAMQAMRTDGPARKRARAPQGTDAESDRSSTQKSDEQIVEDKTHTGGSGAVTPTDECDVLGADVQSTDPSPFSLGTVFDDVSPNQPDVSPVPSDLSTMIEPPMSAPFEIGHPS